MVLTSCWPPLFTVVTQMVSFQAVQTPFSWVFEVFEVQNQNPMVYSNFVVANELWIVCYLEFASSLHVAVAGANQYDLTSHQIVKQGEAWNLKLSWKNSQQHWKHFLLHINRPHSLDVDIWHQADPVDKKLLLPRQPYVYHPSLIARRTIWMSSPCCDWITGSRAGLTRRVMRIRGQRLVSVCKCCLQGPASCANEELWM